MTSQDLDCTLTTLRATTVRLLSDGMTEHHPIIEALISLTAELMEIRQEIWEYEMDESMEKLNKAKQKLLDIKSKGDILTSDKGHGSLQADGNGGTQLNPHSPLSTPSLPSTCGDSDSWED